MKNEIKKIEEEAGNKFDVWNPNQDEFIERVIRTGTLDGEKVAYIKHEGVHKLVDRDGVGDEIWYRINPHSIPYETGYIQ